MLLEIVGGDDVHLYESSLHSQRVYLCTHDFLVGKGASMKVVTSESVLISKRHVDPHSPHRKDKGNWLGGAILQLYETTTGTKILAGRVGGGPAFQASLVLADEFRIWG